MDSIDELTREVIEIVADVAEVDPADVSPTARLEDLDIDSLDGLRIVAAVEKKYRIVIDEVKIASIRTMPDVIALVREYESEVDGA